MQGTGRTHGDDDLVGRSRGAPGDRESLVEGVATVRVPHRKCPMVIRRCNPRCSLGGPLERADRASAEARRNDPERVRGPCADLEGTGRPHVVREGAWCVNDGCSLHGLATERRDGGPQQGEEPEGHCRSQRQTPEAPPTSGVGSPQGQCPAHQCKRRAHQLLPLFRQKTSRRLPGARVPRARRRAHPQNRGIRARDAAGYRGEAFRARQAIWEKHVATRASPRWSRLD